MGRAVRAPCPQHTGATRGAGEGDEGVPTLHAFTGVGPVAGAGSASQSWEGREGADSVPVPRTLIFLPKFVQIFWNRFSSLAVCPQDHFQRLKCCFHLFFCYNLHTFAGEWAAGVFALSCWKPISFLMMEKSEPV